MSEPVISVREAERGIIVLHLEEHEAICDLMEEVLGHTELATLEDLLIRTHENTMGLYDENDLDQVRSQIPESAVRLIKMTENEAIELAYDLVQMVKKLRNDALTRLSLVK